MSPPFCPYCLAELAASKMSEPLVCCGRADVVDAVKASKNSNIVICRNRNAVKSVC